MNICIRFAAQTSILETVDTGGASVEAQLTEAVSIHVVTARTETLVAVEDSIRSTAAAVVAVWSGASRTLNVAAEALAVRVHVEVVLANTSTVD